MMKAAFDIRETGEHIGSSERNVQYLRKNDPTFPPPRLIGSRLRWLRVELDAWLLAQPRAVLGEEPPQLARSTKRRQSLAPTPSQWPVPGTLTAGNADAAR